MSAVTRSTPAGRAYLDLRSQARDIDLSAIDVSNDTNAVLNRVRAVLTVSLADDDGLVFQPDSASAEVIRELDDYSGVRVTCTARLANARLTCHVDVSVGDPIDPHPITVSVPRLRGGQPITVTGYPIPMVHAEKIVTAVERGTANTRWRDFGDIWTLSRHHSINGTELHKAITAVAKYRKATLLPLHDALDGYDNIGQARWEAWRTRNDYTWLPEQFGDVLGAVINFAEPALTGRTDECTWNHTTASWE